MTVAALAARLIQSFEGIRLTSYWDVTGKVWTIGYGHTKNVAGGTVITQAEADIFFVADCAPLLLMVAGKPMLEAAALVSFGFNCGAGALAGVLRGDIALAAYGLTSHGVRLPGLVARRMLEAALIEVSKENENAKLS